MALPRCQNPFVHHLLKSLGNNIWRISLDVLALLRLFHVVSSDFPVSGHNISFVLLIKVQLSP